MNMIMRYTTLKKESDNFHYNKKLKNINNKKLLTQSVSSFKIKD